MVFELLFRGRIQCSALVRIFFFAHLLWCDTGKNNNIKPLPFWRSHYLFINHVMGGMHSAHSSNFSRSAPGEWSFCEAAILPWPVTQLWTPLSVRNCSHSFSSAFCISLSARSFRIQRTTFPCLWNLIPSIKVWKKTRIYFPFLSFYASGCAALAEGGK